MRATIHLPSLTRGEEVWVRPGDPYVDSLLAAGFLVPAKRRRRKGKPNP